MNREAVLHIPLSNYAHSKDEDTVVFRIRTAKNDIKTCFLYYGDRACRVNPVTFHCVEMNVVANDLYYDYFEVELQSPFKRICYYFQLDDEHEQMNFYYNMFKEDVPIERSEFYQYPFNRREQIADIPQWVKEAIVYNIFPDSFASGYQSITNEAKTAQINGHITHSLRGGTLEGIKSNIPYFVELGVNCIYINPIFLAGEWHKYDTMDYFTIDPCFGTNKEFKELVEACHNKGIKVIIDGVFNHCGWYFFAFNDVIEKGENSPYKDWFYGLNFPVSRPEQQDDMPDYDCFAYERKMPKLNTSNEEVVKYFMNVCKYWTEGYNIDGWRLDVANEVDHEFWRKFRKQVKSINKECFIIGEVWETAYNWLLGDQFDSTMNYDFRKNCRDFFGLGSITTEEFDARVTEMRIRYNKNMVHGQLNVLDSHDVPRFLTLCNEDIHKFTLAVVFQMTFIGIPMVYYGDEKGLTGKLEHEYRKAMDWQTKNKTFEIYCHLIKIRKMRRSLKEGIFQTLFTDESGLYVFLRQFKEESTVIVINNGCNEYKLKDYLADGYSLIYASDFYDNEDEIEFIKGMSFLIYGK